MNLISLRSLQIAQAPLPKGRWAKPAPLSWRYRFRLDRNADTGLGGMPVFQTFDPAH